MLSDMDEFKKKYKALEHGSDEKIRMDYVYGKETMVYYPYYRYRENVAPGGDIRFKHA